MSTRVAVRSSGDETRSEIRRVALELFAAQGFEGTPLQQIADRLTFTKAALYYHFKSKEELLTAVLEPLFSDVEQVMQAHDSADGRRSVSRSKRVEDYIDCMLAHRDILGFLSRDLAVIHQPAIAERATRLQKRFTDNVAGADLSLEGRIRVSFAISGLQGAIVTNPDATNDELRGPLIDSTTAALRAIRRGGPAPD